MLRPSPRSTRPDPLLPFSTLSRVVLPFCCCDNQCLASFSALSSLFAPNTAAPHFLCCCPHDALPALLCFALVEALCCCICANSCSFFAGKSTAPCLTDRKSPRPNSSHYCASRIPSSA